MRDTAILTKHLLDSAEVYDAQLSEVNKQIDKLQPKLEAKIRKAINDNFKDLTGVLKVQLMLGCKAISIWTERRGASEYHRYKIGKWTIYINYPADSSVGRYKDKAYQPYSAFEPKLKKFIKTSIVDFLQ